MSQAKAVLYARNRIRHLEGLGEVLQDKGAIQIELELAYLKGSIDAKEKAVSTIQKAFGADFAGPLKEGHAT